MVAPTAGFPANRQEERTVEASTAPYAAPAAASRDRTIAVVAALALLISMPFGWLSGDTSTGQTVGLIVALVICLAILTAVMRWLVPRERAAGRDSRTALILGIVGLVLCVVFWTGLPVPIGAGAVALGLSARAAGGNDARANVGAGLGVLAILAPFVALIAGA
jgi:hypothetical protein